MQPVALDRAYDCGTYTTRTSIYDGRAQFAPVSWGYDEVIADRYRHGATNGLLNGGGRFLPVLPCNKVLESQPVVGRNILD